MEEVYQTFTGLIAKCHKAIKRIKSSEMSGYNLKGLHFSCLYSLYLSERALTSKELSEACDEDKSSISRAVEVLEGEGFVEINSKTKKRYNSPISLTEKGITFARSMEKKITEIVIQASPGITEDKREIFYGYLTLIAENLEKISEKYLGDKK